MPMTEEEGVIVGAVAQDADLAARAKSITDMLLSRIERIVKNGNDQAVLALASRVMPALVKTIGDRGGDNELAAEFRAMRSEWAATNATASAEEHIEAPEDAAPAPVGKPRPAKIRMSSKATGGAR